MFRPFAVGHLHGARKFFDMCSIWVILYGINYIYMIEIIVMKLNIKQTNKLRGLSPHANYTDRAVAAGRRS